MCVRLRTSGRAAGCRGRRLLWYAGKCGRGKEGPHWRAFPSPSRPPSRRAARDNEGRGGKWEGGASGARDGGRVSAAAAAAAMSSVAGRSSAWRFPSSK
eukprot:341411-Chlamydomonas_euryale.AAC.1